MPNLKGTKTEQNLMLHMRGSHRHEQNTIFMQARQKRTAMCSSAISLLKPH